jgi:hypothetical protein
MRSHVLTLCAIGEETMYEMNRHRALADCRRNPLDAAGPCVADGKYSRHTRLR